PKKLAGSLVVGGADDKDAPVIKLEAWGSVTGKILNAQGKPYSGSDSLFLSQSGQNDLTTGSHPTRSFSSDKDGKFRIEGLVPGLKYTLSIVKGNVLIGYVFENLMINTGEAKDLGDVEVRSAQ